MQTIFAWVLVIIMIASAYPLTAWLLAKNPRRDGSWLTIILTLAISVGTLTLLMFWEGLIGTTFTLWGITLPYFGIMIVGGCLCWREKPSATSRQPSDKYGYRLHFEMIRGNWWVVPLVLISMGILFNAAYWPFHHDDVLGIYGKYGKLMYETGALVPFAGRDDAFYQAYPMQIPLAYTFTFLASGWENDYLARVIPALLSLSCLPGVYVLGRIIDSKRTGELAALLLVLTPTFVRWSSAGYVDLPMAFFYTLSAIFAWRLYESSHFADALLLGIMMGLAAWTKNAGLLGVVLIGMWLIYGWVITKRIRFRHILLFVGVCTVIAAPWYIRNWLEAGLIVPPTAWTEQAQRTIGSLAIFIIEPENFAVTGWLIVGGVLVAIYKVLRRKQVVEHILLLTLTVPFFAAWWLLVSYDPRFLLLFLPLLTVMAASWAVQAWDMIPPKWQNPLRNFALAIGVALAIYMLWISVEYKDEILRQPLMGDEAKHTIVLNKNSG